MGFCWTLWYMCYEARRYLGSLRLTVWCIYVLSSAFETRKTYILVGGKLKGQTQKHVTVLPCTIHDSIDHCRPFQPVSTR